MFWKVKYIIDDGYAWHNCVCIIKAESKEIALDILHTEIGLKLKGERVILDRYTEITECENDVILYDSWK